MNPGLTLIEQGIDVAPLLAELEANPQLWQEYAYRTNAKNSPHIKVADIWLRYNDLNKYAPNQMNEMMDEHDSVWYDAIDCLPSFKALAYMLMSTLQGERLGGMLISRLPPGASIAAHVDSQWHSLYYKKIHLILQGEDSLIYSGFETLRTKPGDLFHLDSSQFHGVANIGTDARISVVVCIRQDSEERIKRAN